MVRILCALSCVLFVSSVYAKDKVLEKLVDQEAYELALDWVETAPIHDVQKDLHQLDIYLASKELEKASDLLKKQIWVNNVSPQTVIKQNIKLNQLRRNHLWVEKLAHVSPQDYQQELFAARVLQGKPANTSLEKEIDWIKSELKEAKTSLELSRVLSQLNRYCDHYDCDVIDKELSSNLDSYSFEQKGTIISFVGLMEQESWSEVFVQFPLLQQDVYRVLKRMVLKSCEAGNNDMCLINLIDENPLGERLDWEALAIWVSFEEKTQNQGLKNWINNKINGYIGRLK